jgi:hypothetical protein
VSSKDRFVSAVKIAAQVLPVTSALAQWISEIETSKIVGRLDRLEDPLAKYGDRINELTKELYSFVEKQPQDVPSTHLDWKPQLESFKKEILYLEADGLLTGSHRLESGGEFGMGFRLFPGFIALLAVLHADRTEINKLVETIEDARTALNGKELRQTINLPLAVIDAFFTKYSEQGQGLKPGERGTSIYIPHP